MGLRGPERQRTPLRAIPSIHSTQHSQVGTVWTTIRIGTAKDYVCYTRSSLIKSRAAAEVVWESYPQPKIDDDRFKMGGYTDTSRCMVRKRPPRVNKPTSITRHFNKTPFWEINSTENSYINIPHGPGCTTCKKTLCSINNRHQAKNPNRSISHYHQTPTPTTKSPIRKSSTKPKHATVKETHLKNTT